MSSADIRDVTLMLSPSRD